MFDLSQIDLELTLAELGIKYKVQGHKYVALCPFHNDSAPSFHIDRNTTQYYCFGCGEKGNIITLIRELTGKNPYSELGIDSFQKNDLGHRQVIHSIQKEEKERSKIINNKPIQVDDIYLNIIGHKLNPFEEEKCRQYCLKRNITQEDINKHNMFYLKDGFIGLTRAIDRLVIPIYSNENKLLAYEGRDITEEDSKKVIYQYGSKVGSTVFGIDSIVNNDTPVLIVEGLLDLFQVEKTLKIYNLDYKIICYFGIQLTNKQKELVKQLKNVSLLLDSDSGGERGIEIFYEFAEHDFNVMLLGSGDPNENSYGEIKKAIDNKISMTEFFLRKNNLLQPKNYGW